MRGKCSNSISRWRREHSNGVAAGCSRYKVSSSDSGSPSVLMDEPAEQVAISMLPIELPATDARGVSSLRPR
jgi:hypothetical protein